MEPKKPDLLLLFSGGLDSTLLLYLAKALGYTPHCILINYGQKHIVELNFARNFCLITHCSFTEVNLEMPISSKLTNGEGGYKGVSEWHVPSRNLMFLSITASIAESMGITKIWYGANYEDRDHLFPDCYQEWVYQLNQLLKINGSSQITVEAPLLGMDKPLIERLAKTYFNLDKNNTFSGYGEQ